MSNFNQYEYQNDYNKKKYDQVLLVTKKGRKEDIKKRAKELGLSTSAYINQLIDKDIKK